MFHLDVMNKKVAYFHKSVVTIKLSSVSSDSTKHIFAVSMKTIGAISLRINNQTVWMMDLNVK